MISVEIAENDDCHHNYNSIGICESYSLVICMRTLTVAELNFIDDKYVLVHAIHGMPETNPSTMFICSL